MQGHPARIRAPSADEVAPPGRSAGIGGEVLADALSPGVLVGLTVAAGDHQPQQLVGA